MSNLELDRLTSEATELIRRAVEIGIQMERARLRSMLSMDAGFADIGFSDMRPNETGQHGARRTRGPSSRGPIAKIRKAINEMPMGDEGADAAEIGSYHNHVNPEAPLTDKQVRGALKQLINTGEARRASRGRYLPRKAATSPLTEEEKPSKSDSPGSFDLAAE